MVASHTPPAGDLACNPGMCPDWESNQQSFGLQAGTQSTELYQPGCQYYVTNSFSAQMMQRQLLFFETEKPDRYAALMELKLYNKD